MTYCHIKATDLYSRVRVRDLNAVTISTPSSPLEVWLLALEVGSVTMLICLRKKSFHPLLRSCIKFRPLPAPCLSYTQPCLGLSELEPSPQVWLPSQTLDLPYCYGFVRSSGLWAELCGHPQPALLTSLRASGEATALVAKVAHPLDVPW